MPALEDMCSLTHEITQTHGQRAQAISGLKAEMSSTLSGLGASRQTLSRSQRASLDQAEAANKAAVTGMVKGFRGTRKNMSRKLHGDLMKGAADRSAAVKSTLAELDRSGQAMSIALHNGLAKEAASNTADVQGLLTDLERGRHIMARNLQANLSRNGSANRQGVKSMLRSLDTGHQAMSQSLRAELAQHSAGLKAGVRSDLKDFHCQMEQVRAEHQAVQAEWQKLATTLHSTLVSATKKAVGLGNTASTLTPGPTTAEAAAEENPELTVLRNLVFEHLADRPDGARLVEIEEALGASRFQMSRVLRSLMDDNMVEKREMLYFAV